MSTFPQLNYAILGSSGVFPLRIYNEDISVGEVLEKIPPELTDPVKWFEVEFWVVRGNATEDRTKG